MSWIVRTMVVCGLLTTGSVPGARGEDGYDVVIAGGSTAAFAAAVASAEEGARTCLIEPTDWVGGQLTSSGVPAVDEAWHTIVDPKTKTVAIKVYEIARRPENMTPNFRAMLDSIGKRGGAWVSDYCFEPKVFIDTQLAPLERRLDKLMVLRNAVVKSVDADKTGRRIRSITVVERTAKAGVPALGYDRRPSQDLPDWYDPRPSDRFDKRLLTLRGRDGQTTGPVFIDATEWGEVLVLAGAPYLQGVDAVDGGLTGDDRCGQSIVFGFVERINAEPVDEAGPPRGSPSDVGFGDYSGKADAWPLIWTYRRLKNSQTAPAVGDLSLQNWGYSRKHGEGGNDYPFGYLFVSKRDADAQRADWRGGVDLGVMKAAELRALAFHTWFREHAPKEFERRVMLDPAVMGTGHGLAKLPYIRDTRRSVGLDNYILKIDDLTGYPHRRTGKPFHDRIAIGSYTADIHSLAGCNYPDYIHAGHETLPFFIPFRALTNRDFDNLLVAGKTMAQSFLANSATRLHPIEWSTGTAAGVAAADMAKSGHTSAQALEQIALLQAKIRRKTPIDWTMDGTHHPEPGKAEFP